MKHLLQLLLAELSQWYRVSDILSEDQAVNEEREQLLAEKSKGQSKEKEKPKERDITANGLALKFIATLVDYATEETRSAITQLEKQKPPLNMYCFCIFIHSFIHSF
jgi:hypothetical protein